MIITCPECSTRFNINSDRIPDQGAKVRCARCKHVFLAEKPLDPDSLYPEEMETFLEDPTTDSGEHSSPDESFSETSADDVDFSYDKFQELDSKTPPGETSTLGAEPATEDENFFSSNQEMETTVSSDTDDDFTFTESTGEPVSTIEKVLATEDEALLVNEPVVDEKIVNEPVTTDDYSAEPEFIAQPVQEKKGGPVSSIIRILLLLILGVLIIGGVFVYINGPDQLTQTMKQIFGQQTDRSVQSGQVTLSKLEGKFIKNKHGGDFFWIHGEANNMFPQPRAAIQVKGVIYDHNGKPLLQKTVFCGNPISLQELQSLSYSELEKIMGNQFGKDLSNMKIDSNKAIPFDIVFKDMPQNLSEFSVKVTASEAATK